MIRRGTCGIDIHERHRVGFGLVVVDERPRQLIAVKSMWCGQIDVQEEERDEGEV